MSRLSRAALVFLVAVFCAGEIGSFTRPAGAQSTIPTRGPSLPRTVHATPPPLPFGATPSSITSAGIPVPANHILPPSFDPSKPLAKSVVYPVTVPPLPGSKTHKLSSALRQYKGRRAPLAASGSTIILTGDQANFYLNDQTLAYDAQVFFLCQNMTPSATYRYVMYPPTQASVASANITTNASGQCKTGGGTDEYFNVSLATPVGSATPVSAYSGVWAVAMERITAGGAHIAWDSVAYFVVISTLHFNSYSDAGNTTIATQFTPGSTAYFNAAGLTPNHSYVFGVAYTAADPMNCVYMQPVVTVLPTGGGTCFTSPASGGNAPFNGAFSGAWAVPSNAATGTYSIQLYDSTTQDLVSTQQISVQPNTTTITLQPYSGSSSNTGTNLSDTFATDGFMQVNGVLSPEQSVSGLNVGMTLPSPGFVAGHTYSLALSDPNGAVLTNAFVDNQTFGPAQTFTATGTTSTQAFTFPINTAFFTGIGPTLTSFAPNVMTMQLFDRTAGTVLGSKSFVVLAYQALFGWTSPVGQTVTAQPGGSAVVATVSNTAAGLYGSWNGDGIKQFVIAKDSGNNVAIALNGTSATD
ncbi:MAG: hypothetical protein ABR591_15475, partial [Candidatus Velthaea sp.]